MAWLLAPLTLTAAWALVAPHRMHTADDFPLDDAWIFQVYVRGLLTSGLPTYNPGQPEAGFSSALWLLAAAPGHALAMATGLPVAALAKLTSWGCMVAACATLTRLAEALGASRHARFVPWIVASIPAAAVAAVSGMEATLALACLAWALLAFVRGRAVTAGVALGLAALARPESVVVSAVLTLAVLARPGSWRDRVRAAVPLALSPAAMTPWCLWNLHATGYPLPNTFYVKAHGVTLAENLPILARWVLLGDGVWAPLVLGALLAVGAATRRTPEVRAVLASAAMGVAAVSLTRPLFPQVTFFQQRHFLPFLLLVTPVCALGLDALSRRLGRATALVVLPLALGLPRARDVSVRSCREVFILHTAPAREVARDAAPDAVVGVEAAGSMRFHTARRALDLYGLNLGPLAHARDNRDRTCQIVAAGPTWFVMPPSWGARYLPAFDLHAVTRYEVPDPVIVEGAPRAVVVFRGAARPSMVARCAAWRSPLAHARP